MRWDTLAAIVAGFARFEVLRMVDAVSKHVIRHTAEGILGSYTRDHGAREYLLGVAVALDNPEAMAIAGAVRAAIGDLRVNVTMPPLEWPAIPAELLGALSPLAVRITATPPEPRKRTKVTKYDNAGRIAETTTEVVPAIGA